MNDFMRLAVEEAKVAFNNGDEYLKQLNEYLYQNKLLVKEYLETNIQEVKLINSEATYLLWIDVSKITSDASLLVEDILNFTGLKLASGIEYGENAKGFIRMNIATSKANVLKGLFCVPAPTSSTPLVEFTYTSII